MTVEQRFFAKAFPEPNTGCWLWGASLNHKGYGQLGVGKKMKMAHRVAWEIARGPIPAGMYLDHICRVRCCVNPDHLRVVTPRTNVVENSTGWAATHAARTTCVNCGGPLTTLKSTADRKRGCVPCIRAKYRRAKRKLKERRAVLSLCAEAIQEKP